MKVAPILRALRAVGHEGVLVHTGQHYDAAMSDTFFQDLGLPEPNHHLGAGSGSHAVQTARVMEAFEPVLKEVRPDWVIVVGDVNSTLACSLVTAKLREELGCRLAHVEAGVRSYDWRMPEEVNRVLTDRMSDLLLTPSAAASNNLVAEGLDPERVVSVGNVMIDSLLALLPRAREQKLPARMNLSQAPYAVATLHRPSNVDTPAVLATVLASFSRVAEELPVVFPIHPRTRTNAERFGLAGALDTLRVIEPLGYLEMLSLMEGAAVVLTDSGGLQTETTALGVPCITLREETEWTETVEQGTNMLVPWPLTVDGVVALFKAARKQARSVTSRQCPDGWDGHAAERVVLALDAR
jgi:UDP-N-acetylglucosamine 2-epimerase (non-hydrolysing)